MLSICEIADILRRASDADFGLIVDLEYSHGEPLLAVAKDYPDTDHVILNQVREGKNIASVLFQEQEGSYLAGTLAALVTTDTSIKGANDKPIIGVIAEPIRPASTNSSPDIFKEQRPPIRRWRSRSKVAYSNNFGDPAMGLQMGDVTLSTSECKEICGVVVNSRLLQLSIPPWLVDDDFGYRQQSVGSGTGRRGCGWRTR